MLGRMDLGQPKKIVVAAAGSGRDENMHPPTEIPTRNSARKQNSSTQDLTDQTSPGSTRNPELTRFTSPA
jgi:hypothetical protein